MSDTSDVTKRKQPNTLSGANRVKLQDWLRAKAVDGVVSGTRSGLARVASKDINCIVVDSNITTAARDTGIAFSTTSAATNGKPLSNGKAVRHLSRIITKLVGVLSSIDSRMTLTKEDMAMLVRISRAQKLQSVDDATQQTPQDPTLFDKHADDAGTNNG